MSPVISRVRRRYNGCPPATRPNKFLFDLTFDLVMYIKAREHGTTLSASVGAVPLCPRPNNVKPIGSDAAAALDRVRRPRRPGLPAHARRAGKYCPEQTSL
ncbi:hypothetical protein EVAR_31162_1 [Eumeta japonica]|uniref:Uncharacterized protein n=1 Tax=Eumeta variegata TaxID=151549 RepID=A0A4C1VYE8_EUMVA|nr:hypothetical protein EVAR_31162_1 [Eumeta japonica]